MPLYTVTVSQETEVVYEVEADSKEQAYAKLIDNHDGEDCTMIESYRGQILSPFAETGFSES